MRTLLFVSSRPVWPGADGPSRLGGLLPALRSSWRVVLASPDEPVSVDFGALSAHHFIPAPGTDGASLPCHSVERLIRIESPAAIVLGAGAEYLAFRRTRIWPAIIVDRSVGMPRRWLRLGSLAFEWRLLRVATQTIVATEEDRRYLMRLNNRALITTVADEEHDAWHLAADRYSSVVDEAVRVARVSGPHKFREFALGA